MKLKQTLTLLLTVSMVSFAQNTSGKLFFSHEAGIYEQNFSLEISAENPGALVIYTLDGTDPRFSKTTFTQTSPFNVFLNPDNTFQRDRAPGIVIRACVKADTINIEDVYTHTYLFINRIIALSPSDQIPGPGWPAPNSISQRMDYGLDPYVYNDIRYRDSIKSAFLAIPVISLVTDLNNLFNKDTGIYVNARQHGIDWERFTSVELLNNFGNKGFQINAGLRIRGGYTRDDQFPKHSFRLFFRGEYGKTKLNFPLFEDEGADIFDKVDLRTAQNYAWSTDAVGAENNVMNRDVFSRDTQKDMNQPYTRSRYYHLFINGTYWGLYQTEERPEADYAETYFGGNSEDYDVVKVNQELPNFRYEIEATDGDLNAWKYIWDLINVSSIDNTTFFKLQGLNSDGTRNFNYPVLLDYDNLIDYMLVIFFSGNKDAPVTLNGRYPNNFYAIYNRKSNEGFKFITHDSEHALLYNDLHINIVTRSTPVSEFRHFHPNYLHYKLKGNSEYRLRFADRIYKHFYNNGALTPDKTVPRFKFRASQIEKAIIAESARWGDVWTTKPRTKDDDWLPAINNLENIYLPLRTGIVLQQLKGDNLFPQFDPPIFNNNGIVIKESVLNVESGYKVSISKGFSGNGIIYYTLNGDDPRMPGGVISANTYQSDSDKIIEINSSTTIKARLKYNGNWSALHEITFLVDDVLEDLKITEIHYHPLDEGEINDREFEFIELKNTGNSLINLTEVKFTKGIFYTFPAGSVLNAGNFLVLASNPSKFLLRYKFEPFAEYDGQLDNNGEKIVLQNALGDTITSIRYYDTEPWPVLADTGGHSLVPKDINAAGNPNDANSWRASLEIHGSPGRDDTIMDITEDEGKIPPYRYELYQNYPNPFNGNTKISFSILESAKVTLIIYDLLGRKLTTLTNKILEPGNYSVLWNPENEASGVYFYQLTADRFISTKKLVLLR
ncbi:MAG: hypothetical protein CVV23_08025 [Ignavibacteriae bacterium HGW-Ignavibacteriae-2]|jgi:hypothetical protein|nr:MAG: hypothetical protein CVV23_08025 [Ignavibacteriae bacterium HGW-Ignavibacteriae-2]